MDLKHGRPPGCNGGVCYCNHYHYCNDRWALTPCNPGCHCLKPCFLHLINLAVTPVTIAVKPCKPGRYTLFPWWVHPVTLYVTVLHHVTISKTLQYYILFPWPLHPIPLAVTTCNPGLYTWPCYPGPKRVPYESCGK